MSDGYTRAGYGAHSIGFGERPAVIVVDLQHGFTNPAFQMGHSPHVQRAVVNTALLLKDARRRGIPVATCNVAWGSARDMGYWKISPLYSGWFFGEPATRMDERIHDPAYDFHFTKSAPSMFFGTPLVTFLNKARVDTVIVTGVATSGCVRATIVDSFSHGLSHDGAGGVLRRHRRRPAPRQSPRRGPALRRRSQPERRDGLPCRSQGAAERRLKSATIPR